MSINPLLTNYGPNVSLYAPAGSGGGGGGGAGPNPLVSTLGVNPTGAINMFTDNIIDTPTINFYTNSTNTAYTSFGVVYGANEATSGSNAGVALGLYENDVGNTYGALTCQQVQLCDSVGNLASVLQAGPTPGSAYISSIYVSSLNGAAPGGGGGAVSIPANLAVSTLSINDSVPTNSARLLFNGSDPNLYSCSVVDSNANPVASFTLGTSGGRNQFATDIAQIPLFFTSSILGATGQISMNPAGQDSIRLGGLGAPGDITLAPTGGGQINLNGVANINGVANMPIAANISSLNVSSINGAAPGGGSGVVSVQTITSLGDTVCVCDAPGGNGNPTNVLPLASISTTIFHTYTVSGTAYWQSGGNQSATSFLQLQLGNISRFYDQCQPVSTIIGPNNYYSINWRFIAQGTGQNSIYAYTWDNNGSNASTIVNLQDVSVTDYGILV